MIVSAASARGKDGALNGHRRATHRLSLVAVVALFSILGTLAPAAALTPLSEIDVDSFSSRAEDWTAARADHRAAAQDFAVELAEGARQAEIDQVAAEEAARLAEETRRVAAAAAALTTTTAPPATTAAPPPTAPPTTTTAAPTTTIASDPGDQTTTTPPPSTTVAPAGSPTAEQWNVLRQCESSGNYSIVSSNGSYRGAYQFSSATWDWIASINDSSLVGIDPAAASVADQDAMALALWLRTGWSSWPHCGAQAALA